MKKLLIIILLVAGCCLWASADPAGPDTGKKSVTNTAPMAATGNSGANAQVDSHSSSATPNTTAAPAKAVCLPPSPRRGVAGWTLIIVIIILFIGVAWKSNLLRDPVADKDAFMTAAKLTKYANVTDINLIPKAFSLARTQLAVWTVVISCTYIYLGLIEHFSLTDIGISTTILTLMGISAGTTAIGSAIDNTNPSQQGAQYPSDNFLMDILSDQNGVNIHRFQNVIWTVIAVLLFLSKVRYMDCGQLPTLDSTLIALTGISSATYLGLKVNENNKPAIPPTPVAPVQPPNPNPGP
ncbi:hypothetical protein [Mucilaginibacter sp.]|uniref:hypothetical protein n=1 Tax=Mucilaginibacter sp. TaxID=1882438 RepID=UPI002841095B|nr:hypothetical protein [Mucilaginibacter sp.]MDR3693748.1 hypothetical protein [Mucilaginibacter sp.]